MKKQKSEQVLRFMPCSAMKTGSKEGRCEEGGTNKKLESCGSDARFE
jgi:hypothetical protein